MPDAARKNISVLNEAFDKIQAKYKKEDTDKSFVKWTSDYLTTNLAKEEFISKYFPHLHKIGITDNVLYVKDSKENKFVEFRMVKGVLQSSDDNPVYLQYAMALPEIVNLK